MEAFWFLWIALSVGVGFLANSRGRSGIGFGLLSLITSPLLGLIVVLVIRNETAHKEAEYERRRADEQRLEEVKALAAAAARGANAAPAAAPAAPASPVAKFSAPPLFSVADELIKLAALRDKGLLTEEEFNHQRRALLNMPAPSGQ